MLMAVKKAEFSVFAWKYQAAIAYSNLDCYSSLGTRLPPPTVFATPTPNASMIGGLLKMFSMGTPEATNSRTQSPIAHGSNGEERGAVPPNDNMVTESEITLE